MFLYRDVLGQAWKNTWQNKYFWFFGLFAALLGGWGDLEIVFRSLNSSGPGMPGIKMMLDMLIKGELFSNVSRTAASGELSFSLGSIFIMLIILIISLFLFWLTIVSQSALVYNTMRAATKKKHNMGSGLEIGVKKFWPVLSLNLLLKFVIYGLFSLFGLYIVNAMGSGGFCLNNLYPVIAFVIFVPLAIIISFIAKYAICYTVIKGEKLYDSLKLSWRLFLRNWLTSLEMAFILFFIAFVFALGLLFVFLILSIPLLFVVIVFSKLSFMINLWLIAAAALILFLLIIVLSGAILSSFQISAWTVLFLELISRGGDSKIMRLFGGNK